MHFIIKLYLYIFFLLSESTFREKNFHFYVLAKRVEIQICYDPGHTTWQFFFCPWGFISNECKNKNMHTTPKETVTNMKFLTSTNIKFYQLWKFWNWKVGINKLSQLNIFTVKRNLSCFHWNSRISNFCGK